MNIIIEEVVSEFPVLITEEIVQITISDAVSYFDIVEVADTSFVGKDGYVPVVNEATGKFILSPQEAGPGGGLVLGETSTTAYRGDRGKTAYDHSQDVTNNPHNVTKSQVGLGSVDNTSDINKPISDATQNALDGKFNNPTGNNTQYLDGAGSPTTFPTIPSLNGLVPYTGASQDVDLGTNELKADVFEVSLTPTGAVDAGKIVWNADEGTFDMGLLNGVTLQSGQEIHFYAKASGVITNGDCVQFAGSQGDHLLIKKAVQSEINTNPEYFIGLATQDFANNEFGYATVLGKVRGLNTSSWTQPVLYFDSSGSTPGALTQTEPSAPNAKIIVCAVVRNHATQGVLQVRPHTMPKIDSLQNVNTALEKTTPITGDKLLLRDSVDGVYKHIDWLTAGGGVASKFESLSSVLDTSTVTGNTETILHSYTVPANTLNEKEILQLLAYTEKVGSAQSQVARIVVNTANTLTGGFAFYNQSTIALCFDIDLRLVIKNTEIIGRIGNGTQQRFTIDRTQPLYIFFTGRLSTATIADTMKYESINIFKLKP